MGLLGGSTPTRQIVDLDPGTSSLLTQEMNRSFRPDAEIAAEQNAGVAGSGKVAGLTSDIQQRVAKTGEDPGMMHAIRNQYNNLAHKDIQSVIRNNQINAPMERNDLLNQAAAHTMALGRVQTDSFIKLQEANMMADQARARALSSVLEGVGAIGGMMMAGRGQQQPRQQQRNINDFATQGMSEGQKPVYSGETPEGIG